MGQLFREDEQLAVRNLQLLPRRCDPEKTCQRRFPRSGRFLRRCYFRRGYHRLDSDRDAALLFDLTNSHRSVRAIQNAFDQPTLSIPGPISELWHPPKVVRNLNVGCKFLR